MRRPRQASLERLLEERDVAVRRMLHDVLTSHSGGVEGGMDAEERMQVDLQHDIELGLLESAAEARAEIRDALFAPAPGGEDRCARCAGEIGWARRQAVPYTDLCRDCKEADEALAAWKRQRRAPLGNL